MPTKLTAMRLTEDDVRIVARLSKLTGLGLTGCVRIALRESLQARERAAARAKMPRRRRT